MSGFHDLINFNGGIEEEDFGIGVSFDVIVVIAKKTSDLAYFLNVKYFGHITCGSQFFFAQAEAHISGSDEQVHFPEEV